MKKTKRICLELTTMEYEHLYRAVRNHYESENAGPDFNPVMREWEHIASLFEKMSQNYERNGCP